MSQQAAAGRGAPAAAGRGGRGRGRFYRGKGDPPSKGFKSAISEIASDTFNTGQNRFAAQFTQSRKNVANYLQRTASDEGYLVAETVRTGKAQVIALPPPIDTTAGDAEDQKIIREEAVRAIAKRRAKLDSALKKGYATVWDQCSQEVRDKLEASDDWERTQREQSLHDLIGKIERICVGFDDHKQEIFNLVQALKTLFLYTQTDKETVEEYSRNFKSLWDTVEAFGGSPGLHRGLVEGVLRTPGKVRDVNNITEGEDIAAEEEVAEAVKAALLISGADKRRYGKLKEQLANNYLLGTDQYPNTLEKATRILGNYQVAKPTLYEDRRIEGGGLAFIQRGTRGGRGRGGQGRGTPGRGEGGSTNAGDAGAGGDASGTSSGGGTPRTNNAGESHCYHCGEEGHWARECPHLTAEQQEQLHIAVEGSEEQDEGETGHQFLHVSMLQADELPDNRAYLDGCSTVTAFKSKEYLNNIRSVKRGVKINCNSGVMRTNEVGDYGSMNVWYIPDGIANIFSMNELEKKYRITYDSWEGYYTVHTANGEVRFYKDENGLPYIDLGESSENAAAMLVQTGSEDAANVFVQTVRQNYEGYTKREILRAKEARRAMGMIGYPSEQDFKGIVSANMIRNCPINVKDITNAREMWGRDLASLRGKTVRKTPAPVVADYVAVPKSLIERNKAVTLAADVFFVDKTAFLLTVSRQIKFITAEYVATRTAKNLTTHMERVVEVYKRAGFNVRTILMDGEFEKIKNLMSQVVCNTTAAKEHVSEAERNIRTIKERTRGIIGTLPFEYMPRRLKMEIIYFVVLWLNAFPAKTGISSVHSPRELIVRWKLDYQKHCRVLPGTYCEVHDEPLPSNSMTPRTHPCIACGPTGNLQGSVKFYCLTTGRILKRRHWTELPMPDNIIKKVNRIGLRERQGREFRFLNRSGEPYEWTDSVPEDDPEFQGLLEEEAAFPDISATFPGVPLEENEENFEAMTDDPEPDFDVLAAAALDNAGIDTGDRLQAARAAAALAGVPNTGPRLIETEPDELVYEVTFELPDAGLIPGAIPPDTPIDNGEALESTGADTTPADPPTAATDADSRRYPTRARRSVLGNQPYDTYAPRMQFLQLGEARAHRSALGAMTRGEQHEKRDEQLHTTILSAAEIDYTEHTVDKELTTESEDEMAVWGYLMTQYNLKPGLRKFGEKGVKAAVSELTQLHIMDTWTVMDPGQLTREDRARALSSLLFLKEKRCGKIKGRACINGAPQRAYIPKEEAASPTVSTESMFITAAIAASEGRRVRCHDVPSAFVNTDVDENVLMVLKGELAEMMVHIAPQMYRKHITVDKKGTPVLYVKLQKALYGLMRASLLFYRKLRRELEDYGFVVNPYDPCVANKTVGNGEQLTVIWHVDDLMTSCAIDFELTKFSCYLASIYGPGLTMHTGRKHDYLGIDLEFREDGNLDVSMVKYLKGVIEGFPEQITGKSPTPAGDRLFDIRDEKERKLLDEERAVAFHHTTAQLLFMATRARRDIQTAVAFLTTRVKSPDEDDWGKLKRVLRYLNGTKYLKLCISVNDLGILKWYVDGSHNVHWDCKGHAGAMFTMGEGAVSSYSRKVKLNTRSSTETELVGADMYMPEMLWSLYFMQSQGYNVEIIELFQDNKSTELLMNNGRFSSGKKTKHIKAKFFFVKDRIDAGEMKVTHCPTEEMWADVLTKPLQGKAFRLMRSKLMNCSIDYEEHDSEQEEETGKATTSDERKAKSSKPNPVTGRMSCRAPTQTLQECVGSPRLPGATNRRAVGVPRIQDRMRRSEINKNPTKCQ
jgi:hypothetical protein